MDGCEHAATLDARLGLAARAALAAGEVIRQGAVAIPAVQQKGVGDLVSQVDRDADRAAADVLQAESDLPILSEEIHHERPSADVMWIVDPLDASSAYLMQAGDHYPSVLVALYEHGATTQGVAYFPLTNEWFYASRGKGAWNDGRRLRCEPISELGEIWVEMNQYGESSLETDYFRELRSRLRSASGARMVTTNAPHSGVAVRIAAGKTSLAAAVHDNRPDHVKQAAWDIAAPQLILEEAGGVFVNGEGRAVDPFRAEPMIVARTPELAQRIIGLMRDA